MLVMQAEAVVQSIAGVAKLLVTDYKSSCNTWCKWRCF